MPRRTDHRHLLALLVIVLPLTATALPEDAEQPIHVTANSAKLDEKTGEAVYRGNVLVVQGTLRVNGDTLNLQVDNKGSLQTARTFGKPAHYQQKIDPAKGLVTAEADEIQFDNSTGVMTLIGNAVLRQDGATFNGPRITYSTLSKQVEASGDANQRVQLVFPPQIRTGVKPNAGLGTKP